MNTDTLILTAAEWIGIIALGMLAGLSPKLRNVRPLQFLFPHREASVTFSINIAAFVFSLLIYKYFFTEVTAFTTLNQEVLSQRLILDVIVLTVFGITLVIRKQPLRSALWGKEALRGNLEYALLIAALVIFLRGKIYTIIDGIEMAEGLALLQLLAIGLCEVSFFFGYSMPRLISRFGTRTGWVMAAFLFSLWQIIPMAVHGVVWQTAIFPILYFIGSGIVLGWTTIKSRHVLAPAVFIALSQWLFLIQ